MFAFLLIDASRCTSPKRLGDDNQAARTFKVALKTCRFCLDHENLELALKVLERCADYVSAVEETQPIVRITEGPDEDKHDRQLTMKRFVVEYHLLRITHAWKTERYDVAELFFSKVGYETLVESTTLAEKAADLFHEAGRFMARKKAIEPAVVWCELSLIHI